MRRVPCSGVALLVTLAATSRAAAGDPPSSAPASAGPATPAPATPAPATPDRVQSAAQEFDTGRRAYLAGAFAEAAVHFENAYHDAPRPEPLRSAIRARLAAHDDARAATLASLASVRYGTDPVTLSLANDTLTELSGRLLGVSVACDPECAVAADGRAVSLEDARQVVFYLSPGKHTVSVSWSQDRARQLSIEGPAGSVRDLHVVAPALPTKPPPPPPLVAATPPAVHRKPLGPAVFAVGAGLTVAGVAATILSGVAATSDPGTANVKRECVGLGPSCPAYQRGLAAQLRTNVILGATAGVGVLTAVIGVFFTQWAQPPASAASSRLVPYAGLAPGAVDLGVWTTF